MSGYFLVRQGRGPEWDRSKGRREQAGWDRHAAFVDGLGDRVVIGGPIDDVDGESVVLLVRAEDENEARTMFDPDPPVTPSLPAPAMTMLLPEPRSIVSRAPTAGSIDAALRSTGTLTGRLSV